MVGAHIIDYGFNPNYTVWIYHGEDKVYGGSSVNVGHRQSSDKHQSDEMTEALHDLANEVNLICDDDNDDKVEPVDD